MERTASSSRGYLLEAMLLKSYFRVPRGEDNIIAEDTLPELISEFPEKRTASSSGGYLLEAMLLKSYSRVPRREDSFIAQKLSPRSDTSRNYFRAHRGEGSIV